MHYIPYTKAGVNASEQLLVDVDLGSRAELTVEGLDCFLSVSSGVLTVMAIHVYMYIHICMVYTMYIDICIYI